MEDSSLLAHHESEEKWARARRAVLVQKVVCAFKNCSMDLIPFEKVRERLHLSQKQCLGIQDIDLDRIRGSVGRYTDFTSAFLPRRNSLRHRWVRVNTMAPSQDVPTIELYKVGDAYFVVDGNHRVSNARQEGMKTITADVCEFRTPVGLTAKADLDEVITKSEHAEFLSKTNLEKLRPGHEILFTAPGRYRELECLIQMFQDALEETRGEVIPYEDALLLWYDNVYSPAILEIKRSGGLRRFSGRTEADLFIWMWRHQKGLLERYAPGLVQRGVETLSSFFRWLWLKVKRLL